MIVVDIGGRYDSLITVDYSESGEYNLKILKPVILNGTIWRYGMLTLKDSFMFAYHTQRTFVIMNVPKLPCSHKTIYLRYPAVIQQYT